MPKLPESATCELPFSLGLSAAVRGTDEAQRAPIRMASLTAFTFVPPFLPLATSVPLPPLPAPPACPWSAPGTAPAHSLRAGRQTARQTFLPAAPADAPCARPGSGVAALPAALPAAR